jgi:hypothetical protein
MAVDTAYGEQTESQRDITEMVRRIADEQIIPNAEHFKRLVLVPRKSATQAS